MATRCDGSHLRVELGRPRWEGERSHCPICGREVRLGRFNMLYRHNIPARVSGEDREGGEG